MSRHHIATHAYDYRTGWVRIPPTALTPEQADALRDRGFTIVRSRRGWFGSRELPVTWYLPRTDTVQQDPPTGPVGSTAEETDDVSGSDPADSGPRSTRRTRQRAAEDER